MRYITPAVIRLIFLLMVIATTPARSDTLIDWSADKDGSEKVYNIDGLRLTLTAAKNERGESPRLEIASPSGAVTVVFGTVQSPQVSANVRVTHLDPEHSEIDVMFGAFTGGAHCCIAIKVLSLIQNEWRVADLGLWDGDGMPEPQEVGGKIALVFSDDAFLYSFASYAESAAPLKILRVQNGEIVNASDDPDFKYLNQQNMTENRERCRKHQNGACAAYVASAAGSDCLPRHGISCLGIMIKRAIGIWNSAISPGKTTNVSVPFPLTPTHKHSSGFCANTAISDRPL